MDRNIDFLAYDVLSNRKYSPIDMVSCTAVRTTNLVDLWIIQPVSLRSKALL